MGIPISVRLDEAVRAELEAQAQSRGVGLSTLLRDIATEAARVARRARIRAASGAVGTYAAQDDQARAFYAFWGSQGPDGL